MTLTFPAKMISPCSLAFSVPLRDGENPSPSPSRPGTGRGRRSTSLIVAERRVIPRLDRRIQENVLWRGSWMPDPGPA